MQINSHAIIALDFLKAIKKYGWEVEESWQEHYNSKLEEWCVEEIAKYLSDIRLGNIGEASFISSMDGEIPGRLARNLLKRGFSTTRHLKRCYDCKKCNKNKSTFALIPCGHIFCSSCADESLEASECPRCDHAVTSTLQLK